VRRTAIGFGDPFGSVAADVRWLPEDGEVPIAIRPTIYGPYRNAIIAARRQPSPCGRTGLTAYRTQHAALLEYVRTTKDDLRSRLVERQNCDGYQWALLISTHEQRHIMQIREIKAHPKYPKG